MCLIWRWRPSGTMRLPVLPLIASSVLCIGLSCEAAYGQLKSAQAVSQRA